jgi:hypothetical protein
MADASRPGWLHHNKGRARNDVMGQAYRLCPLGATSGDTLIATEKADIAPRWSMLALRP